MRGSAVGSGNSSSTTLSSLPWDETTGDITASAFERVAGCEGWGAGAWTGAGPDRWTTLSGFNGVAPGEGFHNTLGSSVVILS
eukprot:355733-Chlamydomonas_euryale.AAC.1